MKQRPSEERVAVIGAGCRLPGGADSPASFWKLLTGGRDVVREVPEERWSQEEVFGLPADVAARLKWGAFLDEDVYAYDPAFFGINAHEAAWVDPHHRLLCETFWEAAEHAGVPPRSLSGKPVGTYFGVYNKEYLLRAQRPLEEIDAYAMNASIHSMAAGRIAYLLDLRGPQMTLEAGCSSGLVALHAACQGLRDKESDLAFAGACVLILGPEESVPPARWSFFSPTGRCRAFDAGADGYVRGEGCVVLALKRLHDAVRDGDRILGVIRGSALNQNGGRSTRLTAPSTDAQIEVCRRALAAAGVDPGDVGLVEAHGTGTEVGDPLEFRALAEVYGSGPGVCALGSVKTNIGHTEPVAGLAGVLKALLSVQRGEIPPNLHFRHWNPEIDAGATRFRVPTGTVAWPAREGRRLAVVSSLSVTGANVHVVVEQPPDGGGRGRRRTASRGAGGNEQAGGEPLAFPLSAASRPALTTAARRLARWLEEEGSGVALPDVAHTLAVRRSPLRERLAVVAATRAELIGRLTEAADGTATAGVARGTARPGADTVFLFSGHGSQWAGMCRGLLDRDAGFTRVIDRLEPLVAEESGFSLRQTLAGARLVEGMDRVQPTVFAIQLGLCAMWAGYGVRPAAVIGHSMGEAAAAVASGALTPEEGARVICRRSRLNVRRAGAGRMASIALPRADVEARIAASGVRGVSVAVVTSPEATVIGGDKDAVDQLVRAWQKEDIAATFVNVDIAAHTAHMDPILDELRTALAGLDPRTPDVRFYSTVLDDARRGVRLDADYWAANQRQPVLLASAVRAAVEDGFRRFVEISPHPVLAHAVHATAAALGPDPVDVLGSLHRESEERTAFLTQVAALHCTGCPVTWPATPYRDAALADVPTMSWERTRHSIAPSPLRTAPPTAGRAGQGVLTGTHLTDPASARRHLWQQTLTRTTLPWLDEHRVNDVPVLPGAAMAEMAIACATDVFCAPPDEVEVRDLDLHRILALGESREVTALATTLTPALADWTLHAAGPDGVFAAHAGARLHHAPQQRPPAPVDITALLSAPCEDVDAAELYRRLRQERGITHGPAFQGITRLRLIRGHGDGLRQPPGADGEVGDDEPCALADVVLPSAGRAGSRNLRLHPVLLDICLQAVGSTWLACHPVPPGGMLPRRLGRVRVLGDTTTAAYAHVRLTDVGDRSCTARCLLTDAAGTVLAEADAIDCVNVPSQDGEDLFDRRTLDVTWLEAPGTREITEAGHWELYYERDRAGEAADLKAALEEHGATAALRPVTGLSGPPRDATRGVVYLPALDGASAPAVCARTNLEHLIRLAQSLAPDGRGGPRLWVLTRDAAHVTPRDTPGLAGSGLRGALRVLALEQAALRPAHLDTDRHTTPERLARELLTCPGTEDDIAYREQARYLARLTHHPLGPGDRVRASVNWRTQGAKLLRGPSRTLDDLHLSALVPRPPASGQIQVQLHSTSLNFINVLKAVGTYDQLLSGTDIVPQAVFDGAGTVTAVGEDVRCASVGDLVAVPVCWAGDRETLMASRVTVRADWAVPLTSPEELTHAAGLPIAYLTSWYGLCRLARLAAGEQVLIHSASGGVGLAAVNIARMKGAEVLATAGTQEKRDYLRSLGVRHVMDSRSLDFARQVREITRGRGVDVVLNSLTGPAQSAGLDLLARKGRFIEIGKRDIYEDTHLGLLPFRRNISFSSVDIALLLHEEPALIASLVQEIGQAYAAGLLPPLPMTSSPVSEASEVFRTMAGARHTGNLALVWPAEGKVTLPVAPQDVRPAEPHASYLITGGLGGLGLDVAQWLAARGARALVLGARSEPGERARRVIEELTTRGVEVTVALGDMADPATAHRLVSAAEATGRPLRGVLHAAAVVEDGVLENVNAAQLQRVWDAKALGAWNLHEATKTCALDWWINFTSVAAVIGQPGQTCYAAANSWLDEFTRWRRAQRLPATSIVWGPWSGHGRGTGIEALGYAMISPEEGMAALEKIVTRSGRPLTVYSPHDLDLRLSLHPDAARLAYYAAIDRTGGPADDDTSTFLADWNALTDPERRTRFLHEKIKQHTAAVLRCPLDSVEDRTAFAALGLDSLLAIQLRNRIAHEAGVELPTTALWTHPTPADLAGLLTDRLPK
ncbi:MULTISPECIES: type I polyketide synthase [unclassified Streptomyces]|uniref:SDR family NAD(P)-dependent oxidoreductase n=1 Tax=unclassified Streptomyces TaxID=2593676 RepID=UPI00136A5986|nr:SDR family NAD(P)-dependent oxidoreductase [Streptomyces sp. SID6139]MYR23002.1 SDR family NAD(P)-dependent oxidoreductase [Streptomyces sp. SID6137]